jgi:outer membrane protein
VKKISGLALLFFVLCSLTLSAQQKYGHINSTEILDVMPEYKQMKASLQRKQKEQEGKLRGMYTEYEKQSKELNEFGAAMMEAVREEQMMELDSLGQAIQAYEAGIEEEIQRLQFKLIKPINDKYIKIVDIVAKENNYTYIFDIATGSVVYHPENTGDITGLVKIKMGIN